MKHTQRNGLDGERASAVTEKAAEREEKEVEEVEWRRERGLVVELEHQLAVLATPVLLRLLCTRINFL